MAGNDRLAFVKEGYWHDLPLGNRKIWIPEGTHLTKFRKHGTSGKRADAIFYVKHPEELEDESVVTMKDAAIFGVIVPLEKIEFHSQKIRNQKRSWE